MGRNRLVKLRCLDLRHYRNIGEAHLEAHPDLTVVCGENGQGKTNLLESVFLLTGSKSFRGTRDADLVQEGELLARVAGTLCEEGDETHPKIIDISVQGHGAAKRGRFATVNGVDQGRATALAGLFTAVVFDPGHLSLIKGGPEGRRRFLDAALCQLYPGYLTTLRRFLRAVSQKNALLKKAAFTQDADSLLDIFDTHIAEAGEEITRRRSEYLAWVGPKAEAFYAEISRDAERLEVRFHPCCASGGLSEVLAKSREADLRAGHCTRGPQREDFTAQMNGRSAKAFGSQGQQRSAVLSLKLAEAARAKDVTGHHPMMLLDDVLSELDEKRQAYLLGRMQQGQCLITTCDGSVFQRAGGKIVHMQGGVLTE